MGVCMVYVSWANQAINELELLEGNGAPLKEEDIGILEPLVQDKADSERGGIKPLQQDVVKVEYGACTEVLDLDQLMRDVVQRKSVAIAAQQQGEEEDCCCVIF